MGWEVLVILAIFGVICAMSIVGAYWFAERTVRTVQLAWSRAQRMQDDAWDRMNKERVIWISKTSALVENNLKLSGLSGDSARREIMEAQRWMEVTRQDIIKDVARTVDARLAAHQRDKNEETAKIPVFREPGGYEARATPSNSE